MIQPIYYSLCLGCFSEASTILPFELASLADISSFHFTFSANSTSSTWGAILYLFLLQNCNLCLHRQKTRATDPHMIMTMANVIPLILPKIGISLIVPPTWPRLLPTWPRLVTLAWRRLLKWFVWILATGSNHVWFCIFVCWER